MNHDTLVNAVDCAREHSVYCAHENITRHAQEEDHTTWTPRSCCTRPVACIVYQSQYALCADRVVLGYNTILAVEAHKNPEHIPLVQRLGSRA